MDWETPQEFYDAINLEFAFDIDLCASIGNAKHTNFYSKDQNSLSQEWKGTGWLNPPYDKSIGLWMKKAYEASQKGATIVCLIQGRSSDTVWWHEYVMRSSEIRYIKNRIHFGKDGIFTRSNISSVVVVFTPYCQGSPKTSSIDCKGLQIV